MRTSVTRTLADAAASAGGGGARRTGGHRRDDAVQHRRDELNHREASSAPADAAGTLLGVKPVDDPVAARFGTAVHWGYGAGWGAVRGLLTAAGLRGPAAGLVHYGLVWGGEQAVLPATGAGRPVWSYGATALATDAWHHAVYAAATSLAYEWLDRRRS